MPFFDLKPGCKWEELEEPIYKFQTPDGRRALIVKTEKDQEKKIFFFVEQLKITNGFISNILLSFLPVSFINNFLVWSVKRYGNKQDIVGLPFMPTKIAEAIAEFVKTEKKE